MTAILENDVITLKNRVDVLRRLRETLRSERDAITEKRAAIASRLAMKPIAESVLEQVAAQMHEAALGRFERMLTLLVQDMFPERPCKVRMETRIVRGAHHIWKFFWKRRKAIWRT